MTTTLFCAWPRRPILVATVCRRIARPHRIRSETVLRLVRRSGHRTAGDSRAQIERYVRWMQEIRRFKPSTVSRRMAVITGFYRRCVIDAVLEHSPADYVRRPLVPAESPTLGLSHLQFEELLSAARESSNHYDFALVAMLGLLGLRSSRLRQRHQRRGRGTRPPGPAGDRRRKQGRAGAPAARRRPRHRLGRGRPDHRGDPAQPERTAHGPDSTAVDIGCRRLVPPRRGWGARWCREPVHAYWRGGWQQECTGAGGQGDGLDEVDRQDRLGLRAQEGSPGHGRALGRPLDASGLEDFTYG
jgi:hypothetical protein